MAPHINYTLWPSNQFALRHSGRVEAWGIHFAHAYNIIVRTPCVKKQPIVPRMDAY